MKSLIMMASLLFSIIACGQTKPKDMDDKKQIEQLYKQMYQAMIAKDIATLNTILAEGSVLIHMTGTKQPKKQYLHEIENGTLNYYSVEDDEISITVNGVTAEMTGRSRVNAPVLKSTKGYTEDSSRSGELYNLFLNAIDRFHHRYSDVFFYAEQLSVSARYLGQVTRHIANRSPKAIIDERITEDITTMLATNKPLKEIALMLGFSSQAHLSRYYRKQTGKAPSEVRKR